MPIRLLLLAALALPLSGQPSPFCSDCEATRKNFRELCDYLVKNKAGMPTIFVAGYYMRTLVAGYQILGDRRYLDVALAHGDKLLDQQMPSGYWGTGYGPIYLADTANALGEILALDKHADAARRARYFASLRKLVEAIERDGMVRPSGAIGTGFRRGPDGKLVPYADDYSVSSALIGGETFLWMYRKTGEERYRRTGYNAVRWVLDTIGKDGVIPYILPGEFADPKVKGDPENDFNLWERLPYTSVTYDGEGIVNFDLHCDKPEWQAELRRKFRPVIEQVLRTQRPEGFWGDPNMKIRPESNRSSWRKRLLADVHRSPGVVTVLTWWYMNVEKDPRIVEAVRRFDRLMLDPHRAAEFGMLHRRPGGDVRTEASPHTDNDVATAHGGRAIADILSPGIDYRW